MATATLFDANLKIIPLSQADLGSLELLFDEQCAEWLSFLQWDYSGPSRLVREVARQNDLEGVVALNNDQIIGFAFYVVEQTRCSIGDIYVSRSWRKTGADRQIAAAIIRRLELLPGLNRIESQCVGIGNDAANSFFENYGFKRFDRLFMVAQLKSIEPSSIVRGTKHPGNQPDDVVLRPWEERDSSPAANVIYQSHRLEHDSLINSQYRSQEGCAELVTVLTDSIWCGSFLPTVTHVAEDTVTGKPVGVLIASRMAARAGHFGQVSVLPSYQNQGIGRRLIAAGIEELRELDFNTVSLAVTSLNEPAVHLYQACGFRTIHTFPVFYFERD
jgi:ribosomal protein S18 acetylase RimI-like enzyme